MTNPNNGFSSDNPFANGGGFNPSQAPSNDAGASNQTDPWSSDFDNGGQNQGGFGNQGQNQVGSNNENQNQGQNLDGSNNENQNQGGFGNQNGFGNQEQNQGGFGNQGQNQGGFGNQGQNQAGFGNQNQGGFGNQDQNQGGFGNQDQNQGGFGNQNQGGFGNRGQNQGGFGNQDQNQGGFGNQNQGGFGNQNQGGFGNQGQGGFGNQNQGGFGNQGQGGFGGQDQQSDQGNQQNQSFSMDVDLDNAASGMYQAGNIDRGDIRKENGATLLIVPVEIQHNVPSKKFNNTYTRAVFNYLVIDGPNAGNVYYNSMNANAFIWRDIENAGQRRVPIVGQVVNRPTEKAAQGAWMIETVNDQNVWRDAIEKGKQMGLI